jgi:hypothetical protein
VQLQKQFRLSIFGKDKDVDMFRPYRIWIIFALLLWYKNGNLHLYISKTGKPNNLISPSLVPTRMIGTPGA